MVVQVKRFSFTYSRTQILLILVDLNLVRGLKNIVIKLEFEN